MRHSLREVSRYLLKDYGNVATGVDVLPAHVSAAVSLAPAARLELEDRLDGIAVSSPALYYSTSLFAIFPASASACQHEA